MQLTIKFPENTSPEQITKLIHNIKQISIQEGIDLKMESQPISKNDPCKELDFEQIAVETGVEDFAENHDHYLYGVPKK
ncbi:hypothetical protein AA637_01470 [Cyanobacterium sp. HL-69]|uniref:hypothetical protein n=1 Tax=Cyanobacterium sp. HL-69 TaxID=2054282 RepID=UPI000CA3A0BE|nr:hypothetical protein AA637_01470 [Cyanobacterium sp. HL-69]